MVTSTHIGVQSCCNANNRWRWTIRIYCLAFVIFITGLTTLVHHLQDDESQFQPRGRYQHGSMLFKRDEECRFVRSAQDQCEFIRANCPDEEAGLLSYLSLYYCRLSDAKPLALIILLLWLGLLFSTIGIAASDFFSINLSTIATLLGLSESVAGVTFLAFGNGSPDVFSTFAAFNTHSGSLAIGELIGAAGFITAVVAGSMAIVRPFKVARRSFVRDVSCFVIAASFSMVFLADGRLTAWECAVMVAFYLAYVIFVVVWQWVLGRRRRNKLKEATARSHFSISELPGRGGIEEEIDNQDDTIGSSTRINKPIQADDFAALEEAGWNVPDTLDDEEQSEAREQWMVEINRNMRVQRPALGPHRNTGNQIRPSLVGALEFRAVLSSLEKLRDQRAMPIGMRRYSDDPSFTLAQQQHHHTRGKSNPQVDPLLKKTDARLAVDPWRPYRDNDNEGDRPSRNRAVSANDAYLVDMAQASSYLRRSIPKLAPEASTAARLNLPANSQSLAVPCLPDIAPSPSAQRSTVDQQTTIRPSIHSCNVADHGLQRPIIVQDESFLQSSDPPPELNRQLSNHAMLLSPGTAASSPAAPFPPYYDDPSYVPSTSRSQSIMLPPPSVDPGSFFSFKDVLDKPRPLRWWPYRFLPSPSVLASTLFPTLYSWSDKGLGERLLGVVSAPTIFLLTITLPVVEYESNSGETVNAKSGSDIRAVTSSGGSAATLQLEVADESLLEQRNTTEVSNSDGYADPGSSMPSITSTSRESETIPSLETSAESAPERSQPMKNGWNRWLLSTQIFTAPLFVVLILWANLDEQHSINNLALYVLYALLGSLCIFAALLLTTTDETPPKYRSAFCFVGFVVSVAWISTIAGEVVGVLKALGVILGISDAILGLTIFAVGNSLGDLVADITVAKLGFPVMALSACFGGPMLNILLGIGISGLYMTLKETHGKHHHGQPTPSEPYHIEVHGTLVISGISLLVTLVGLLVAVPMNKWVFDRKIGWSLVLLWTISTVANVVIEATGMTSQMTHRVVDFMHMYAY